MKTEGWKLTKDPEKVWVVPSQRPRRIRRDLALACACIGVICAIVGAVHVFDDGKLTQRLGHSLLRLRRKATTTTT